MEDKQRFTRNDKLQIVTDNLTGLTWQDEPYTDAEDMACHKNENFAKCGHWDHVTDYAQALKFAGFSDWRLPTKDELQTIIPYKIMDTADNETLSHKTFKHCRPNFYWSSTTRAYRSPRAWQVSFYHGSVDNHRKSYSNFVRCVRG